MNLLIQNEVLFPNLSSADILILDGIMYVFIYKINSPKSKEMVQLRVEEKLGIRETNISTESFEMTFLKSS